MANVADVVFVIRRDRVDVYCNPVNYVYLLPLIAHWRRLRIHCLPEAQVSDNNNSQKVLVRVHISAKWIFAE